MTSTSAFSSLLWFIAILLLIPAVLWLVKRSPAGARFSGVAPGGVLRHVSALPLSASQRIVTVEVGQGDERRWLVLGVTPQSISTLHTMAPQPDAPSDDAPPATPFAQLLGHLRNGKGASRDR
ncbi:MAG: flagellar biosynthetic protein FliO [Proteobacteria bacterium]|nr:flagellar biosynthetic protein FliO [Pseudomonadota bacterium]